MDWLIIPVVAVLGMMGGQFCKAQRRYGIPISYVLLVLSNKDRRKQWRKYIPALLAFVLSMGYGENSKLSELLGGKDWLVRMVYGLIIGAVVACAGFVYSIILMPLAFVVRVNLSFKIWKYDFVVEDFIRYSVLGFCLYMCFV